MAVSITLSNYIANCLTDTYKQTVNLTAVAPVSGGDINAAYCLQTNVGKFMLKLNSKSTYPNMFKHEAEGLAAIRETQTIAVPEVILQFDLDDDSGLLMQWIESVRATPHASAQLGNALAAMHKHTALKFGFDSDNYMGLIPQSNLKHDTWEAFFIQERLTPMVKTAVDKNLLQPNDVLLFERLYLNLSNLFDEEPPALIHGDLWGGNYLIKTDGTPYLIDPAVCYGHREFDISMTTLFGGFSDEFYSAYDEAFPLAKGWQKRVSLWNLYPLLLHLNLFGTSYLGRVRDCLRIYV